MIVQCCIIQGPRRFFRSKWNIADVIIALLCVATFVFYEHILRHPGTDPHAAGYASWVPSVMYVLRNIVRLLRLAVVLRWRSLAEIDRKETKRQLTEDGDNFDDLVASLHSSKWRDGARRIALSDCGKRAYTIHLLAQIAICSVVIAWSWVKRAPSLPGWGSALEGYVDVTLLIEVIVVWWYQSFAFLKDPWNYVDICIAVLCFSTFVLVLEHPYKPNSKPGVHQFGGHDHIGTITTVLFGVRSVARILRLGIVLLRITTLDPIEDIPGTPRSSGPPTPKMPTMRKATCRFWETPTTRGLSRFCRRATRDCA